MIRAPKPGQRVRLRYGKKARQRLLLHNRTGTVIVVSTRGIRNAMVDLDCGLIVIAPRGNLFPEDRKFKE